MTGYPPTPMQPQPDNAGPDHDESYADSRPQPQFGQQDQPSPGDYAQTPYQSPYQPQSPYAQPGNPHAQTGGQPMENSGAAGYNPYVRQPYGQQPQFPSYPQNGQTPQQPFNPASGQPYPPQGMYNYPPVEQPWNAICIAGFVLSFVFAPVGLVLSIVALVQLNSSGEKSKGMAIAGIIISIVNTLVSIAIIAGIVFAVGNAIDSVNGYDSRGYSYDSCSPGDSCDKGGYDSRDYGQDVTWHEADLGDLSAGEWGSAA
ncbi:DUF4190 domain-containing protein [Bifidobacterium sp.]|nr:DUF4190 domain-containing protein [Bifidobacterium sp.]MCH4209601.1 DUF4190 domain-containing protein [Bifidobacterium sp.]